MTSALHSMGAQGSGADGSRMYRKASHTAALRGGGSEAGNATLALAPAAFGWLRHGVESTHCDGTAYTPRILRSARKYACVGQALHGNHMARTARQGKSLASRAIQTHASSETVARSFACPATASSAKAQFGSRWMATQTHSQRCEKISSKVEHWDGQQGNARQRIQGDRTATHTSPAETCRKISDGSARAWQPKDMPGSACMGQDTHSARYCREDLSSGRKRSGLARQGLASSGKERDATQQHAPKGAKISESRARPRKPRIGRQRNGAERIANITSLRG